MNIELNNHGLPSSYGDIVDKYLKKMKENVSYKAYTIDKDLNLVEVLGSIENNNSWNYHNNYDDSENELYVQYKDTSSKKIGQWWTPSQTEAKKIHIKLVKANIKECAKVLKDLNKKLK